MVGFRIEARSGDDGYDGGITSDSKSLFRGGITTSFIGKTNRYTVDIYNSGNRSSFTEMPDYSGLVDAVTGLYLGVYPTRDRDISIERVKKSLSYPRTILMMARYQGVPVGFGIFPRLIIDGEPVLYSSRAFLLEHEAQGLGTHFLSEAIRSHQEESARGHRLLRYGVLMTQNAFSVLTLRRLPIVAEIYPFGKSYDRNLAVQPIVPYDRNRQAQSYALGVHQKVYLSSLGIDTITGVSKGELRELGINEAYRPNRQHTEAWAIHQTMVSSPPYGIGVNREAGDVDYVTFEFRRPNGTIATILLPQAA